MSLEEDMARRAAQAQAQAAAGQPSDAASSSSTAAPVVAGAAAGATAAVAASTLPTSDDDDEDAALQAALALSRASGEDVDMHDSAAKAGDARTGEGASAAEGGESMDEDLDEEEAIARAIQMSMQPQEEQKK